MYILKLIKFLVVKILNKVGLEIRNVSVQYPDVPVEANLFHREVISNTKQYSMTPTSRMWALIQSIEYINQNKVLGDFVECGVWKGGN